MFDSGDIHKTKGKICAYVLRLDGDDVHPWYIYCGFTSYLEVRMLQHTGAAPGGSSWCLLHPPNEILSVRLHESTEEAMAAECGAFNLWAGRLKDYDRVRGGRLNCTCPLKYKPRGWKYQEEEKA